MGLNEYEMIIARTILMLLRELWLTEGRNRTYSSIVAIKNVKYEIEITEQADYKLYRKVSDDKGVELLTVNDCTGRYSEAVDLISRCIQLDLR